MTLPLTNKRSLEVHATRSVRLADDLKARLFSGKFEPGTMLPSRRALASEYGVALPTLEQAIKLLIAEGYLRAENGRGTFVREDVPFVAKLSGRKLPENRAIRDKSNDGSTAVRGHYGIIAHFNPQHEIIYNGRSPVAKPIVREFEQYINEIGGISHYVNTSSPPVTPHEVRDIIRNQIEEYNVAGVLIALASYMTDLVEAARLSPVPSVIVQASLTPVSVHQVYYDSRDLGYRAADHLIKNGCRRLAFIGPYMADWAEERLAGVRDAAAGRDVDVVEFVDRLSDPNRHIDDQIDVASAFAATLPIDELQAFGFVACNDAAAIGFMDVAGAHGLKSGQDYAIVGFDDHFKAIEYGLTTFRPPFETMGREAARLLHDIVSGEQRAMRVCLHSEIVIRKSSNILSPADAETANREKSNAAAAV